MMALDQTETIKEDRFERYFWLCNKWLYIKNHNLSIFSHEKLRDAKRIAVYGLGNIGKRLVEDFECEKREIAFLVDRNARNIFAEVEVFPAGIRLPDADILIVSMISEFEEIRKTEEGCFRGEIISLETIINELWIQEWI